MSKERLVELIGNAPIGVNGITLLDKHEPKAIEQIADYLLANGVIVPPCKVGDKIYCIVEGFDVVMEGIVRQFIVAEGIFIDCVIRGYFNQVFHNNNIGKTVFLTREEAEAKLRREDEGK